MSQQTFLLAGFGGQGLLFAGKVIACAGMLSGKEISWIASYGPEMRGGTANCSVILSDEPIGSPLVLSPSVLVALNLPSFDKFEKSVAKGGIAIIDSSMIERNPVRDDINYCKIPVTRVANENDLKGLSNMVVLGVLLKLTNFVEYNIMLEALKKSVPAKKEALIDSNIKAIELGFNYDCSFIK